jgi:NitT/TauT family transport system substrate-binding protein
MTRTRKVMAAAACAVFLLAACGDGADEGSASRDLDEVTFMLGFRPNVTSSPWYLGIDKGFFEEAGIDLTVQPADAPAVGLAAVLDGQADFASVDFTTLGLAKTEDPDLDMRILSVTYARPPYTIFSLKEGANITTPQDLVGHTVHDPAASNQHLIVEAWLEQEGIEGVRFEEADPAVLESLLLTGEIEAMVGFAPSIPAIAGAAEKAGKELAVLEPAEFGLDTYYASGVAAKESAVEADEDLTRRFLGAYVKSFAYAFEHPDEAAAALSRRFPEQDAELVEAGVPLLEKMMTKDGEVQDLGVIDPAEVEQTIDLVADRLGIEVDPEELYLTGYVPTDL